MWQYRELIFNLTIAELKNKYQNTSLGFFWSLLAPLLLALVLWVVFRNIFSREEHLAINIIVGIITWRGFANSTSSLLTSVFSKQNLVTKIAIPRQILVLSTTLAGLVSSLLEFIILIPIVFWLVGELSLTILLYPIVHVVYFIFIYGIGLAISSFYIYFRDMKEIWAVLTQILFYTCPIIYPLSIVPSYLIDYYLINPITNYIIIYRDIMIQGTLPSLQNILVAGIFTAVSFLIGTFIFFRLQRRFAEEI
ncbi:MAG: ABC transporter permease [Dehalococcoidales bacterium]|nr:ABC transporter permease [Dehalococcoidales bacterium]